MAREIDRTEERAPDALGDAARTASAEDLGDARTARATPSKKPSGPRDARKFERGDRLGRYFVVDPLGEGGMGVVVSAYDPDLDRKVAIKVLLPTRDSREAEARLIREARAMARLSHRNVVSVFDAGRVGDQVFLAMELLSGTLLAWLNERERPLDEVLPKVIAAGRGLAAAHREGFIHRDFKPSNVLLGRDDRVAVSDFGLVTERPLSLVSDAPREPAVRALEPRADPAFPELTRPGARMGTPSYMSPEQYEGRSLDARSDQFSFAVVVYEAVFRARPFARDATGFASAWTRGDAAPPPTEHAEAASWLWPPLKRALALDPSARFASMEELLEALESDPATRRRRKNELHALIVYGEAQANLGDATAAEAAFREVAAVEAREHEPLVARAEVGLVWVVGRLRGRPVEGLELAHRAARSVERLAKPGRLRVVLANHRALLLEDLGRVEEARYAFEDAIRRAIEHHGPEHATVATCLNNYADLLRHAGRRDEARSAFTRALHIAHALLGTDSEEATNAHDGLARVLQEEGDFPAARAHFERVLAARERRLGARHRDVGAALSELGDMLRVLGDLEGARPLLERSVAIAETAIGPDHEAMGDALHNLALLELASARDERASELAYRAQAIYARALGHDHVRAASTEDLLGKMALARGDPTGALACFERALRARERAKVSNADATATSCNNVAAALEALGRVEQALAMFERARCLWEERAPVHPDVALALTNIGTLLVGAARLEEAIPPLRRALEITIDCFEADHPHLADAHVKLADALLGLAKERLAASRPADAIAPAEEAIANLDADARVDPGFAAHARFVLAIALFESGVDEPRARALGELAREGFGRAKLPADAQLAELEAWLEGHALS